MKTAELIVHISRALEAYEAQDLPAALATQREPIRLDDIKNDLIQEVGRTRAILRGLQLIQREEAGAARASNDLAYLIELAAAHVASADELTERLDQAVTNLSSQEAYPCN